MTAEDFAEMPEFLDLLEAAARSAEFRITLEANKQWAANLQKELENER